MNYYISDLHFFCRSQIDNGGRNYDGRPFKTLEEMHEKILTRWNEKITNGDNVYILGDIAMRGKNEQLIARLFIFFYTSVNQILMLNTWKDFGSRLT